MFYFINSICIVILYQLFILGNITSIEVLEIWNKVKTEYMTVSIRYESSEKHNGNDFLDFTNNQFPYYLDLLYLHLSLIKTDNEDLINNIGNIFIHYFYYILI